ncbi:gluconolactonase precursor [Sesbania bispinosa]|nr:gluconolactonase precursor [Sesbania bispinosa]
MPFSKRTYDNLPISIPPNSSISCHMSFASASPSSSSGVGSFAQVFGCYEQVTAFSCHPGVGIIVNVEREGWSGSSVGWTNAGGEDWTDDGGEG